MTYINKFLYMYQLEYFDVIFINHLKLFT